MYDGSALWQVNGRFDSICTLYFKKFPFDRQTCSIDFEMATVWDALLVEFDKSDYSAETRANVHSIFTATDVWELISLRNETYNSHKGIRLVIEVQRKSDAYYGTIFLPMAQLNILQVSVFFMPPDTSDRPGFSVTIFLSSSVLLGLLATNLPPTAEVLYLQINFGIQISIGVIITIWILISNRLATTSAFFTARASNKWIILNRLRRVDLVDAIFFFISVIAYILVNAVIFSLMSSD